MFPGDGDVVGREHPPLAFAWGCGAFDNDAVRTARDFREALEGEFDGAFRHVTFAITDWSPDRRFLHPVCDAFSLRE